MGKKSALVAAVIASLCAFAGEAAAQNSGEYPLRVAGRPQTIPARTIRGDAQFLVNGASACVTVLGTTTCASATSTYLNLGAGFGINHDLEVGATVAPLQLTEDFQYNNPSLYARYQFFHGGPLQVGAQLVGFIPVRSGSHFQLSAGLPVWYNLGDMFQVRTGVFYDATFSDPVSHSISIPLQFLYNITDQVHVGLLTGVNLPLKDTGDRLSIPLGVEGGFVLANVNNRPLLDLGANFAFPNFAMPGSSGDTIVTNFWQVGVTARYYYFM